MTEVIRQPVDAEVYAAGWMRALGFYDAQDRALMTFGHDPSFDMKTPGSTFRILLRLWGGAIKSADRYVARVDTELGGRLVPEDDLPLLLQVGVWLERTHDARYPSGGPTVG